MKFGSKPRQALGRIFSAGETAEKVQGGNELGTLEEQKEDSMAGMGCRAGGRT